MLAVPLLLFFTGKLRELAIAHKRLTIYASTDALTQVMNRAAFATLVDAYLKDVRAAESQAKGAFLIIDADNFKSVNDRFGHDRGDEALVTIARAIVGEPALLLADEPTGNLDPQLAVDILGLLEDINATGVTVLFATHDRTLLDVRPRRVVVLDEGKAIDVPGGLDDAADHLERVA